jgi:hypothetical protein
VKYLGNTPVDSAAGAVAEAVKTILLMVTRKNILFLIIICTVVNRPVIENIFIKLMYAYSSKGFHQYIFTFQNTEDWYVRFIFKLILR